MKKSYVLFVLFASLLITNCGSSKSAVKVDPYIGAWNLLIENTPQGNVSATMTITKNTEGAYSGSVNSDVGAFDLYDIKIMDSKLTAGFMIQGAEFDIIGNFENLLFKGYVSGMGEDYQASGTKIIE
ncbi:hypothetical protein [Gelidibacter gilvus]|uniref:Lipocalin-like domain-containing protein n=1 Tax=Gelidibacter gilvus TaxID=59602 RepID=A0A4Q0XCK8_9FLAO|nr:hypothetical protein [Gelidibacter gilvus]RXJ45652.1 hypothetical protein ESZ48_15695 [Gelidibacter gilvus]